MDDPEHLALSDPEDEDLEYAAPVIDGTVPRPSAFDKAKDVTAAPLDTSPAASNAGISSGLLHAHGRVQDDRTKVQQLESTLKKALLDLEEQKAARQRAEAKLEEVATKRQEEAEARERQDGMRNEAFSRMKSRFKGRSKSMHGKTVENQGLQVALRIQGLVWPVYLARAAANDAIKQRDEALKLKQEAATALEALRADCDAATSLVSAAEAERVAARAGITLSARPTGGQKVGEGAGVRAVVEAFRKRVESMVDELAKQRKQAQEDSERMHEQMEQRNISVAIEVSEMEATITRLKEEVAGKDGRFSEAEKQVDALTRRALDAEVALGMERRRAEDLEASAKSAMLEARKCKAMVEEQRAAVNESRQAAKGVESQLADAAKARDRAEADAHSERKAREKAERERDIAREGERTVTRDIEAIVEQWREAKATWRFEKEELDRRVAAAEASRDELVQELASMKLRSEEESNELATLRRDLAAKSADLVRLEVVLKESQNDNALEAITAQLESAGAEASTARAALEESERGRRDAEKACEEAHRQVATLEAARDAAVAEASAASASVERLQEEVQALRKSLADARREVDDSQRHVEEARQDAEKERNAHTASEERDASVNAQLRSQVALLEEEVALWKTAANDEATAGASVLEEVERCNKQISGLVAQMAQWKKVAEEASAKVLSKEEMAAAAIAARDAAERSLRIADRRAAELRARVETLASQLEDVDGREEARRTDARETATSSSWGSGEPGCLSSYWPWLFGRGGRASGSGSGWLSGSGTWLGPPGAGRGRVERVATAEMEQLMEPFV